MNIVHSDKNVTYLDKLLYIMYLKLTKIIKLFLVKSCTDSMVKFIRTLSVYTLHNPSLYEFDTYKSNTFEFYFYM